MSVSDSFNAVFELNKINILTSVFVFAQNEMQTKGDLSILLKLQRRVKDLEEENRSLWQQLDKKEEAQQENAKVY